MQEIKKKRTVVADDKTEDKPNAVPRTNKFKQADEKTGYYKRKTRRTL
jgi:hypothetical protein